MITLKKLIEPYSEFNPKKLIQLLVIVATTLMLLTWLYLQSEQVNISSHLRYGQHIRKIDSANAKVNAEVLAARLELSKNYDSLDAYSNSLFTSSLSISYTPDFISTADRQEILVQVESIQALIKQKVQLLEQFKQKNTLLRNSQKSFQNLLEVILLHTSLPTLHEAVEHYARHILLYSQSQKEIQEQEVEEKVHQIANSGLDWLELTLLKTLFQTGQVISHNWPLLNGLITQMHALNISLHHEKLVAAYINGYDNARKVARFYRNLLYLVALLLTAYLAFIFYMLEKMRRSLSMAHQENLESLQAQKRAEKLLLLHDTAFNNTNEAITITDCNGKVIEVNPAFTRITGYERSEVLGKNPRVLKSGRHDDEFYKAMWKSIIETGNWRGEIWNRNKYGVVYPEILSVTAIKNKKNEVTNYVAVFSDIGQIKEQEQKLQKLAHYDALTNLPNRVLLMDRINQAKLQAKRKGNLIAVCFMDLDGFKPVNDTYGHEAGDKVLVEISNRLTKELRGGDTISRLGGDEFVFLLLGLEKMEECYLLIQRIMKTISTPFAIDGDEISLSASIGITFYPNDDMNAEALLRHADHAMYRAKQKGKNGYCVFNPEQDVQEREQNEQIQAIENALIKKQFILYYQPKVALRTDRVIGLEALIRWQLPDGSIKMPNEFLPLIEDHDLIIDIGDWVIKTALEDMTHWQRQGLDIKVSINVTSYQLHQPEFVKLLNEHFSNYPEITPSQIELEVLETTALEDIVLMSGIMEECKKIGVEFALDDFGTGYSSLTYLKRLPANALKVDMSFVRDMLNDPENLAIVHGIVGLASAFQRDIVVEGVETLEHGEMLIKLGCSYAQGFAIAKPMPAGNIPNWVNNWKIPGSWKSLAELYWDDSDFPLFTAEIEHMRWISLIIQSIHNAKPIPHKYINDVTHCNFGIWYHGSADKYQQLHPALMKKIGEVHQQVHKKAENIDMMIQDGRAEQAKNLIPELIGLRDQLTEMMHQLAIKIAKSYT